MSGENRINRENLEQALDGLFDSMEARSKDRRAKDAKLREFLLNSRRRKAREQLLATKPKRESFETDEEFEEALGYWRERQGRSLALTATPEPTRARRQVSIKFFTVLVKRESITDMIAAELIDNVDSDLVGVTFMSAGDAEQFMEQLCNKGLTVGEDLGLADMFNGPLIECAGIFYERDGDEFMPRWTAVRSD